MSNVLDLRTRGRGAAAVLLLTLGLVSISARTALASVTATPASVDFGEQVAGTTSPPHTVDITNDGEPVAVTNLLASHAVFDPQTSDPDCTILGAGATCTITITFSPVDASQVHGSITVTTDEPGSFVIPLQGQGTTFPTRPADLSITPPFVAFSDTLIGETSAQSFHVTNSDQQTIAVTGLTPSHSSFSASAADPDCSSLVTGATCTITVTFTPFARQTYNGSITVGFDAVLPVTVSVTGRGIVHQLDVTPLSLAFGDQRLGTTSAPGFVAVTNTGDVEVTVWMPTISAADFAQTSDCGPFPTVLAVGESCTVSVTFTPLAKGTRTGSLTVANDSSISVYSVSLTGRGVPGKKKGQQ